MITDDIRHAIKESALGLYYEYSLPDIAEALFLSVNTISAEEKRAIEKFKIGLSQRGYTLEDFLSC